MLRRGRAALANCLIGAAVASASPALLAQTTGRSVSWTTLAANTYLARARNHAAHGDTIAAIVDYTEALRIEPNLGPAYLELAIIRRALGDERETEYLLNRAAALADVRADALAARASWHLERGKRSLALADLKAAVETAPTSERLRALADFYVQDKAWVAALATWRRLEVALAPSNVDDKNEAREVIAALSALAAEADGVQHDMRERSEVRRVLRRHATPLLAADRPSPRSR